MSKDFNADMFSAILASNEKTTAMLATQLENAQNQAKWNEIKFYVTVGVFATLFGVLMWLYYNKKVETPTVTVSYDQDASEANVNNQSELVNVKTE